MQLQLQYPAPQRDCCIMRRTRAQGREAKDGVGEGGEKAKKCNDPQKEYIKYVENVGDLGKTAKKN